MQLGGGGRMSTGCGEGGCIGGGGCRRGVQSVRGYICVGGHCSISLDVIVDLNAVFHVVLGLHACGRLGHSRPQS